MQSDFSLRLDQVLGLRQIFHVMECYVCGYDEYYFQHPNTKKQIGFACEGCNYFCIISLVTVPNVVVTDSDSIVTKFRGVSYSEEITDLQTSKISLVNAKEEILSFANINTAEIAKNEVVVPLKPDV